MIQKLFGVDGAKQATGIAVIIDIFRAATVESFLLDKGVLEIIPVASKEEAFSYKHINPTYLLAGEENGYKISNFDIGNSPFEINQMDTLTGKVIVHRSSQGTQGIVNARNAKEIIFGSFTTAAAIEKYLTLRHDEDISLVAMDGPGSEDDIFADYMIARLTDESPKHLSEIIEVLRNHPGGARFLDPNNKEFLEEDFYLCLDLNRFDFICVLRDGKIIKAS